MRPVKLTAALVAAPALAVPAQGADPAPPAAPAATTTATSTGLGGAVSTVDAAATKIGLRVLKKGGNAVDAAIATAICLTVVEPVSNGIGSDAFAIIWMKDHLYGLNSSGFAPGAISADIVRGMGHTEMPIRGLRYIRGETSRSASPNVRRHAAGRHVSRAIRRHEARSSS